VFGRNRVRISPIESAEIQNTANVGNGSVSVFKIIPDSRLFRLLKRYAVYFDRPVAKFLQKKKLSPFSVNNCRNYYKQTGQSYFDPYTACLSRMWFPSNTLRYVMTVWKQAFFPHFKKIFQNFLADSLANRKKISQDKSASLESKLVLQNTMQCWLLSRRPDVSMDIKTEKPP